MASGSPANPGRQYSKMVRTAVLPTAAGWSAALRWLIAPFDALLKRAKLPMNGAAGTQFFALLGRYRCDPRELQAAGRQSTVQSGKGESKSTRNLRPGLIERH